MSIIEQNKKQIRDPMDIFVGFTSRENADLTFTNNGRYKICDSNISTSIDSEAWKMRTLTDLKGDGFPLDGSAEFYDNSTANAEIGKVGVRSNVGEGLSFTLSSTKAFDAVTLAFTGNSEGTVTATVGGKKTTFAVRRIVVVPVSGKSVRLDITNSNSDERLELASATAGISIQWDKDSLISVNLNLRSNLNPEERSWEISDIEVEGYWDDDLSEIIGNMNDDVPITYYAGYSGDYSETRKFYLSEPAAMSENVITIKGEDMSHKLEDAKNVPLSVLTMKRNAGWKSMYNWAKDLLTKAGIKLDHVETPPNTSGSATTTQCILALENSPRDFIAEIMRLSHSGSFWLTFVDAGIPTLRWTKPTSAKWDIYESDCGDVEQTVGRKIISIATDDEDGLNADVKLDNDWDKLTNNLNIKAGKIYKKTFSDAYYWKYKIADAKKVISETPDSFTWMAKYTTTKKKTKYKKNGRKRTKTVYKHKPILYGKKLTIEGGKKSIKYADRQGKEITESPILRGKIYQSNTLVFPNYSCVFNTSNIGGSFTWKGDPRMQPRDLFNFHRLDGSVELCTIESIEIEHEEGGTQAKITYRKGNV